MRIVNILQNLKSIPIIKISFIAQKYNFLKLKKSLVQKSMYVPIMFGTTCLYRKNILGVNSLYGVAI